MSQLRNLNIDSNIDLDLSFAFNQTFNIFYPKILYASFLAFNLPYTNLNITFYILTLAFFGKKALYVLGSQGQAACLIANLQKKTIDRLAPFKI